MQALGGRSDRSGQWAVRPARATGGGLLRGLVLAVLVTASSALVACASQPAASRSPGDVHSPPDVGMPDVGIPDVRVLGRQILVTVVPRDSWQTARAGTSSKAYSGRYQASARTRKVVEALADDYQLVEVESWPMRPLGVHCVVFETPEGSSVDEVVASLSEDRRVESVEPMQIFAVESTDYDDPYLDLQHGVEEIKVRQAQRWSRGAGVRIAVIDTGVDIAHPELAEHVRWVGDFVDSDGDSLPADRHGTAVAGVIVASVNNGIGIIGVAPSADLLVLRACWQASPHQHEGICNSFTLAKALVAAIERRPDILNLSLAGPPDPLLERLLHEAVGRGVVVVAARSDRPDYTFPAAVEGVVAVGAPRPRASQPMIERAPEVQGLLAPGDEILTTVPGGGFDFVSGHSLAAAHVSGVVALLLERRPRLSGAELARLLGDTSGPDPVPGVKRSGMIDACTAIARLVPDAACGG